MKIFIRGAAAALALSLAGVSGAEAQLTSTTPSCWDWDQGTAGYSDCSGAWAGNPGDAANPHSLIFAEIVGQGWLTDPVLLDEDPDVNGGTTGTISFSSLYTNFVISLKAGDSYSLYHFTGSYASLDYNTVGSGCNPRCASVNGLSNWEVYGGNETSVPEPGTMLLLGTGLLGMAFARRRKDEIEA